MHSLIETSRGGIGTLRNPVMRAARWSGAARRRSAAAAQDQAALCDRSVIGADRPDVAADHPDPADDAVAGSRRARALQNGPAAIGSGALDQRKLPAGLGVERRAGAP